jgi:hypothetical protein
LSGECDEVGPHDFGPLAGRWRAMRPEFFPQNSSNMKEPDDAVAV